MSDFYTNNDDMNSYGNPDPTGQPNNYYTNNDLLNNYPSSACQMDNYYVSTDEITEEDLINKNFVIKMNTQKKIVNIIGLLMLCAFYLIFCNFIKDDGFYDNFFKFILFAMFMLIAVVFVIALGKKIKIVDKTIIITRLFYRKETISIKDITKCEVITGLISHRRNRIEHYNKVVIYYVAEGKERMVYMTDTMYTCYNELVRYMDYYVKCDFIDGINYSSRSIEIH